MLRIISSVLKTFEYILLVLNFFPIPNEFPIPIHIWELFGIIGKYWEAYKTVFSEFPDLTGS
jgi:hypothetical protein